MNLEVFMARGMVRRSGIVQEYMQVGLDAAGRQDNMPGVVPPEPQFFAGAGAMGGPPMGVGGVPGAHGA